MPNPTFKYAIRRKAVIPHKCRSCDCDINPKETYVNLKLTQTPNWGRHKICETCAKKPEFSKLSIATLPIKPMPHMLNINQVRKRTNRPSDFEEGQRVQYFYKSELKEKGTVSSHNSNYVFVRFDDVSGVKPVQAWDLIKLEDSPTTPQTSPPPPQSVA